MPLPEATSVAAEAAAMASAAACAGRNGRGRLSRAAHHEIGWHRGVLRFPGS